MKHLPYLRSLTLPEYVMPHCCLYRERNERSKLNLLKLKVQHYQEFYFCTFSFL